MRPTEQLQVTRLSGQLRVECRNRAERSLPAFARLYLGHHLERPASRMHRELYALLEAVPDQPGARMALAAPRGGAKSTLVSLIFVLWSICHRRHRFIVLLSDTSEKAAEFLDHIKHELVQNERLAKDYPEVCEPGGRSPRYPRWRSNEIITHNNVKVSALGVGQNIRGRRHVEKRPDLMILDDVETRENTHTSEARANLAEWFNKSILKAGTKATQVIVVGTIQHYDSLLARLTDPVKSPLWTGRIYRSVIQWSQNLDLWQTWAGILHGRESFEDETGPKAARRHFEEHEDAMLEGSEVLWPEVEDYYTLMLMRESEGRASFDSEKQNEPVDPKDCLFLEEDFQFWDDQWDNERDLLASIGNAAQIIGACDPSLGKLGKHADDSAIITIVRDPATGVLYVLDADIDRRKPDQIIEDVLRYCQLRQYLGFAFEVNQFQQFLADELRRRGNAQGVYPTVEDIIQTSDKLGRIQRLQPLVRSGTIRFSRRHKTLLDQLRYFPKAAHDDGPDALEMAVELAKRFVMQVEPEPFVIEPIEPGVPNWAAVNKLLGSIVLLILDDNLFWY